MAVLNRENRTSAKIIEATRKWQNARQVDPMDYFTPEAFKSTLTKGIVAGLHAAAEDEVTSPTFTLLHEYDGTREGKPVKLFHLDVYRLEGERQLETLGLDELLTPDALVLVEWGEKFKSIRKKATGEIAIASAGGDARKISVTLKE